MNPFMTRIVIKNVLRKRKGAGRQTYSSYEMAKGFRELAVSARILAADIILVTFGILSAGFGLRGFLLPNKFIDGGATGISLLLSELTSFSLPLLLVVINIPFLVVGFNVIGKQFALRASLAIVGLAVCTALFPYPEITHDKLLVSVFGGFFLGAGIGFSVRGGAVIDGTEVLALYLSRKLGITIGDFILVFNLVLFSIAAYLLSVETALYSILTYLAASKTVDFIIEGIEEYTGVTIISVKPEAVRQMIINDLGRGVTVYKGERGFGKRGETEQEMRIIYTVITRLEMSKLNAEIEKIDPNAFVVMSSIKDTKGGMIKKRPFKH
ncbi:MAG: YitT family protein [Ignavibacteriales bacterium]|nr:YitT family protein [Ignavibacteriales bacterium]